MVAVVVAAILLMTTAGVAMTGTSLASDSELAPEPVDKEFTVLVKQFSFEPAVIVVEQGDRVRLNLRSTDVEHGFYIDGYDVDVRFDPTRPQSVEFVADKAGTFKIRCSVTCGPFHPFMAGKFVVRQNANIIPWLIIVGATVASVLSVSIPAFRLWRNRRNKGK